MQNLVILGGGITGLAAAYIAAKSGSKVTVLEGSPEMGGLLRTFPIGGNRLECYYHHFFTHDAELRWLIEELGIADRLEFFDATMGVFRQGAIHPFNGAGDLFRFRPLGLPGKLRFAASSAYLGKLANWRHHESESAMSWFRKYAGTAATEAIWGPLLNIKFGPYADQLPTAWMVGRLRQRMNSRRKGDEKLGYIRGSLKVLLDCLLARLTAAGVELITDAPVQRLLGTKERITGVETARGTYAGDAVLATIPTPVVSSLAGPLDAAYAEALARIKYFGAVCTILETSVPLSSTYWLNVADPGYPFGGVVEHTNLIPSRDYGGSHITYLSRYYSPEDPLATASREEILDQMLAPLSRMYPAFSKDMLRNTYLFKTSTAAVVCDLNFSARVPHCKTPLGNLYLACMAHVYPDERSCNNSIRVAAEACRVMGIDSSMVPKHASLSGLIHMD